MQDTLFDANMMLQLMRAHLIEALQAIGVSVETLSLHSLKSDIKIYDATGTGRSSHPYKRRKAFENRYHPHLNINQRPTNRYKSIYISSASLHFMTRCHWMRSLPMQSSLWQRMGVAYLIPLNLTISPCLLKNCGRVLQRFAPLWNATHFFPLTENTQETIYWHKRGYRPRDGGKNSGRGNRITHTSDKAGIKNTGCLSPSRVA